MRKINMNLPDELINKLDEKAKSLYMTRTSYVIMALTQKIQSDEVVESLPEFKKAISELTQIGNNIKNIKTKNHRKTLK